MQKRESERMEKKKGLFYMNRNESERRQTKKRNTLSLLEINNQCTMSVDASMLQHDVI